MKEEFGGGPEVKMVRVQDYSFSLRYQGFARVLTAIILPQPQNISEESPLLVKFSYEPDESLTQLVDRITKYIGAKSIRIWLPNFDLTTT